MLEGVCPTHTANVFDCRVVGCFKMSLFKKCVHFNPNLNGSGHLLAKLNCKYSRENVNMNVYCVWCKERGKC